MKTLFSVIAITVLLTMYSYPQAPDTLWTKTFGGSSSDGGKSVQQTSDGGYIVTGTTRSFGAGNADIWLIKTDVSGDTLWTKTFGGSQWDNAWSVHQTSDDGYIVTGFTASFGAGEFDVWLIKTDASGDTLWTKTFGGSGPDEGRSVHQTADGGYIVSGYTYSFGAGEYDVWLIKTNASGDILWTKTFGGSSSEFGSSVQQTSDGGYIITGSTYSFGAGDNDAWLIKTDTSGDTLWTKTFGGSGPDDGYSVHQTADGGYIVTGTTASFGAGEYDVWLIKTDASGDTIWTKTFGGVLTDRATSVQQTFDGGYIVSGYTHSFAAVGSDVWLIKADASGDTLWTKTFGGSSYESGESVHQTADGGYIVTGSTMSFGAGGEDIWLIKLEADSPSVVNNEIRIVDRYYLGQNYPNPFNPSTIISWQVPVGSHQTLKIYDVLGNEVATLVNEYKPAGSFEVEWNASGLPSGVYFYQLKTDNHIETKKMLLLK